MENFTNELIDTKLLPKFEQVQYRALHPKYWNVTLINIAIFIVILCVALGLAIIFGEFTVESQVALIISGAALSLIVLIFSRIAFKKKGFAFRTHDVLFRSGIIATNTIVIPYNRIQHVSIHEGWLSRSFGLAKIEIFTAGGSSSDIGIPGIEKEEAENIKQLITGKIQKQL